MGAKCVTEVSAKDNFLLILFFYSFACFGKHIINWLHFGVSLSRVVYRTPLSPFGTISIIYPFWVLASYSWWHFSCHIVLSEPSFQAVWFVYLCFRDKIVPLVAWQLYPHLGSLLFLPLLDLQACTTVLGLCSPGYWARTLWIKQVLYQLSRSPWFLFSLFACFFSV